MRPIHKSNDKAVNDPFSAILSHTVCKQHTISRVKYTSTTQFLSQTISKLICNLVLLNEWQTFGKLRLLI